MMTAQLIQKSLLIPVAMAGQRLDWVLAQLLPEFSRQRLQTWLAEGSIRVDGAIAQKKQRVQGIEQITVWASPPADSAVWQAQAVPIELVHVDEHLIVVNKSVGMVVHPAAGNWEHTLVNGLLHRFPELAALPRAGIVHRLDKDTSGLLVVARTLTAHTQLVRQLQARTIHREYRALVQGHLIAGGEVDAPIGRHPRQRTKMAVVSHGKPARTHYRVLRRWSAHSWLSVRLETGRTHQIRVHLAHRGHPLVGDSTYGARCVLPPGLPAEAQAVWRGFRRQALHAQRLSLQHPHNQAPCEFVAPLPDDLQALLATLPAG